LATYILAGKYSEHHHCVAHSGNGGKPIRKKQTAAKQIYSKNNISSRPKFEKRQEMQVLAKLTAQNVYTLVHSNSNGKVRMKTSNS